MKLIYAFLLVSLLSHKGFAQKPLFALLSEVKNSSEFELKKKLVAQDLEIATLADDKEKNKKRVANFKLNLPLMNAYNKVKNDVDVFINQLKADVTISNKKKVLKKLNNGTNEQGWYKTSLEKIQNDNIALIKLLTENNSLAVSAEEVTGIFTALVGVVTSARDFRAQQIKALCEQLDTLRLKEFSELTEPVKSEKSEEK